MEEIQSDWAQKGKREGFASGARQSEPAPGHTVEQIAVGWQTRNPAGRITGIFETRQAAIDDTHRNAGNIPKAPFVAKREFAVLKDGEEVSRTDKEGKKQRQRYGSMEAAEKAAEKIGGEARDMGFGEDTEAWVGLVLKRIIRYAAEEGFDRVAWTTGAQQADRYDLAKQVDKIEALHRADGTIDLMVFPKSANEEVRTYKDITGIKPEKLDEVTGKDLAEKILAQPKQGGTEAGWRTYRGLDLKVGGEGMRAFYDRIVPNVANDILKKFGGGRVGEATIILDRTLPKHLKGIHLTPEERLQFQQASQQPGFDMTPKLRESALAGLPLFSVPGAPFAQSVSEVLDGKLSGARPITLGATPAVLRLLGAPDLPLVTTAAVIDKAHYDHGLARALLQRLPTLIADPVLVFDSATHPGTLVVVTSEFHRNAPVIVAIHPDKAMGRLRVNFVASGYGKDRARVITQWAGAGLLRYRNQQRSPAWATTAGLQLPRVVQPKQGASHKIVTERDLVKFHGSPDDKTPLASRRAAPENTGRWAREGVSDTFTTHRTFNRWWHTTVGTQMHKAKIDPHGFGRVFWRAQDYLDEITRLATQAEGKAPALLPRFERFADFFRPREATDADLKKVGDALYAGTLAGGASPFTGKRYSDEELIRDFALTARQRAYYRQVLDAVGTSLDDLARSFLDRKARLAGLEFDRTLTPQQGADALIAQVKAQLRDLEALKTDTKKAEDENKQRITAAKALIAQITDIAKKNARLKEAGYIPLMRFGNHAVYATEQDADGNEHQIFFGMYDSEREANRAARALRAEYPEAQIRQGPVSKENYRLFAGVSPETLALFAEHTDLAHDPLFEQYLQLAVSNRSALKRLIKRKGTPGFSRDLPRTLAHFIISNSRLAAQNHHFAPMRAHIDELKGDVRDEAQKLFDYLAEPNEEAAGMRAYLFFHFLGGSVASAAVNATQPITTAWPYLAQFGGAPMAAAELTRAAHEAARNAPGADVQAAYRRAQAEGLIAPQEIYQLMAEARGTGTGLSYRFNRAWGMFFGMAEQFNRRATFIAAYRIAVSRGEADSYAFAKQAVDETQFIYSRANRPNWARTPVGATVFTFKQFSVSYLEMLKRLPRSSQLLALGILIVAAGIEGLPFADDLDDLIDTLGQWLGFATNTKRARSELAAKLLGEGASHYVLRGFSAGLPFDLSNRLGLSNLLPGTAALKPSETNRLREAAEALGPAGGLLESTLKGVERAATGDLLGAARLTVPLAVRNAYDGYSQWTTGQASDERGRLIAETTPTEAGFKALGFTSARLAGESRSQQAEYGDIELQRKTEARLAERITRAVIEGDPSERKEALSDLREWNRRHPDLRIRITRAQIEARVRAARTSRAERFRRAAPPELRGSL